MKRRALAKKESEPAKTPTVSFPLRVAAVDVGSNALRFLAAEFSSPGVFSVLASERVAVRLGHEVFLTGKLSKGAVDAAIQALCGFRKTVDKLKVGNVRAVATSAVRESLNGADFAARARKEAKLELEVISGFEEARLIHLAIRQRIPMGNQEWLLCDLGGGSVEVSLADGSGVLWSESHTMGAVRLLEELSGGSEDPGRFMKLLEEYASTLQIPSAVGAKPRLGYIATGGNAEAIAALAGERPGPRGVSVVPVAALRRLIEKLARLSYRERITEMGLNEDRADVILPAAIVYERLGQLAGGGVMHVPHVGLREGVLYDLVDCLTARNTHESAQDQQALMSATGLGRRYFFDEPHALHVAKLAASLYGQTTKLHNLGAVEMRILTAAAVLHDVGSYISFKSHHKHSWYIIAHSELPGFSPREMLLAAAIARYHRKGGPKPRHEEYAILTREERRKVDLLAGLLRLADALDREHRQSVRAVFAREKNGAMEISLDGDGDLLLERWALRRKADLFEKAFGVKIRVSPNGGKA
ncbi:MAG: Ppx/GppA family phosphatase [Acidobacteria bacterium]|nr:Ppx/GppA family phosphatase [Acidobacteriota bacterium]